MRTEYLPAPSTCPMFFKSRKRQWKHFEILKFYNIIILPSFSATPMSEHFSSKAYTIIPIVIIVLATGCHAVICGTYVDPWAATTTTFCVFSWRDLQRTKK